MAQKKKIKLNTKQALATCTAMLDAAHLSTNHIRSKTEVAMFEMHVLSGDIERLTAALSSMRRRRQYLEGLVEGFNATVNKR